MQITWRIASYALCECFCLISIWNTAFKKPTLQWVKAVVSADTDGRKLPLYTRFIRPIQRVEDLNQGNAIDLQPLVSDSSKKPLLVSISANAKPIPITD